MKYGTKASFYGSESLVFIEVQVPKLWGKLANVGLNRTQRYMGVYLLRA